MTDLGVIVGTRLTPSARGAPTDTGTWFPIGLAGDGPLVTPTLCRSLGDFINAGFGARDVDNLILYDSIDAYFREGGKRAVVTAYGASGSDDFDSALEALEDPKWGPGQLSALDEDPDGTLYGKLLDLGLASNKVALLDVENADSTAAMQAKGGMVPDQNMDYGAVFGGWVNIPPPAGVIGGTARQIPASPIIAALCARVDAEGNPNRAAAGTDFPLQYVTSLIGEPTFADRVTLLDNGVNTFIDQYGRLENYGFQTAVAFDPDNPFWQFNCARARMHLRAQAKKRGENYMFKNIDAQGHLAGALKTDLDEVCLALFQQNGLFGQTPGEAFATEVGVSVNTIGEIAQGHLHAVTEARFSLHSKAVYVDLVTIPVTGAVTQSA